MSQSSYIYDRELQRPVPVHKGEKQEVETSVTRDGEGVVHRVEGRGVYILKKVPTPPSKPRLWLLKLDDQSFMVEGVRDLNEANPSKSEDRADTAQDSAGKDTTPREALEDFPDVQILPPQEEGEPPRWSSSEKALAEPENGHHPNGVEESEPASSRSD